MLYSLVFSILLIQLAINEDLPQQKNNADIPETISSSDETVLRLTIQNVTVEISNQATQSVIQNTLSALRCLC